MSDKQRAAEERVARFQAESLRADKPRMSFDQLAAANKRCKEAKAKGLPCDEFGGNPHKSTQIRTNPHAAIPHVFHRIWLGDKPLPQEFAAYGKTWEALHPGWEMWTWNESNIMPLRVEACRAWAHCKTFSQKSDVVRYHALVYYGGVYIDTDMEALKNIEPLLQGQSFVAAREEPAFVGSAFFACSPGHPVMKRAVELLGGVNAANITPTSLGPALLTKAVEGHVEAKILAPALIYPYHWTEKHRHAEKFPDAFAAHHWSHTWK